MDILPKTQIARPRSASVRQGLKSATTEKSKPKTRRKKPILKRLALKYSLAALNLVIIGLVAYAALMHPGQGTTSYGVDAISSQAASNPLDSLTAADIAANVAQLAGLPEELAVTNQANTINLYLNSAVIDKEYVAKGQILSSAIKTKADIVEHTVAEGETVSALATKYGVTSDSIKWSNNLNTDRLTPGAKMLVPPINGIVFTVGVGDTAEKLAGIYSSDARAITAFNDAEVTGLTLGDRIVIPNGVKPRPIVAFRANYGFNGYWYGYCTWYVATRISVPNNWRDANQWDNFARATPGWVVSSTPVKGAIAQSNSGPEGHVAVVDAVSDDGTMIKYSDMNGLAGWNRVGSSDWVPALSRFQNFIYRAQ